MGGTTWIIKIKIKTYSCSPKFFKVKFGLNFFWSHVVFSKLLLFLRPIFSSSEKYKIMIKR